MAESIAHHRSFGHLPLPCPLFGLLLITREPQHPLGLSPFVIHPGKHKITHDSSLGFGHTFITARDMGDCVLPTGSHYLLAVYCCKSIADFWGDSKGLCLLENLAGQKSRRREKSVESQAVRTDATLPYPHCYTHPSLEPANTGLLCPAAPAQAYCQFCRLPSSTHNAVSAGSRGRN